MEAVGGRARRKKPVSEPDVEPAEGVGSATVAATATGESVLVGELLVEPPPASLLPAKRPSLVPEWVPKLQVVAGGLAVAFAAIAIVVERHEARFHGAAFTPDDDEL